MRYYSKYLFLIVPMAVVVAISWYLHSTEAPTVTDPVAAAAQADGAMVTGIHMVQNDGQRIEWTLTATRAERKDPEWTVVSDPILVLHEEDGNKVQVTSREGEVNDRTHKMRFTRNVLISDDERRSLATEELRFDPEARTLENDVWFLMSSDGMRVEGTGLRLDQNSKRLVVSHKVKVMFLNTVLD